MMLPHMQLAFLRGEWSDTFRYCHEVLVMSDVYFCSAIGVADLLGYRS